MDAPNLIGNLRTALRRSARTALDALVSSADESQTLLYLVGGGVRDLILGRPTLDIDLTLEGDAAGVARRAATKLEAVRCVVHPTFGTATLRGRDFRIDVATARAESYERPGALPVVRPGSLRDDLLRRDFTINAMALAVNGERAGEIADPSGGRADLDAELVRVLHEGSFQDDATRILRAARYEQRLGFRIEPDTERWLRRDVRYLDAISAARVHHELVRCLREAEPERVLARLKQLGALPAIHPALSFDEEKAGAFVALRALSREPSVSAQLALLAWDLSPADASAVASRLALDRRQGEAVRAASQVRSVARKLSDDIKPSEAVDMLSPSPVAAVWALAVASPDPARRIALLYLRRWRVVKPSLDGNALMRLGAQPGPKLGEVLGRLKAARLDGEVRTRRDEEQLARTLLES